MKRNKKKSKKIIDCCKSKNNNKKCKRKDGKIFKLPRKKDVLPSDRFSPTDKNPNPSSGV